MRNVIFLLAIVLNHWSANAQSVKEIDDSIDAYMNNIRYWGGYANNSDTISKEDSLSHANWTLCRYITVVSIRNSKVLNSALHKTEKTLTMVTSDDNKLRLYSWDSWMGGTERCYEDVAQYQSQNGIRACNMKDTASDKDYGTDYRSITTIHTKSNRTVYLVQDYCVASTKDRAEGITAYTIEKGSLKRVNLFRTKTKSLNSIGYGYDAFLSWNKFPKQNLPTIHLSKDKQKLFIPIVGGRTNEEVTNKYLIYVFDGNNYVFDKNAK